MTNQLVFEPQEIELAQKDYQLSESQLQTITKSVAKWCTKDEVWYFLNVAKQYDLSPFRKELRCYKDTRGNLLMFCWRDWFLALAQKSQLRNGVTSGYVCKNDKFEVDIPNRKIMHVPARWDRWDVQLWYCITTPKGCDFMTIEIADISTYDKKQFVRASHKGEMIQKVAEVKCLRKAYGINGLYSEDEFNEKDLKTASIEENNFDPEKNDVAILIKERIQNCDDVSLLNDIVNELTEIRKRGEMSMMREVEVKTMIAKKRKALLVADEVLSPAVVNTWD